MEMQNLTVGVIGTGRIGKAVIHNLSGFGCRIIAHDPFPSEEMKQMGVEYVSLESLYAQSDVITLHTFLNDSTYHMINTEAIQQMKPGVVIINCARGALIDTRALIDGIESGRVGSVGVDCFEGEDDVIRVDHQLQQPRHQPRLHHPEILPEHYRYPACCVLHRSGGVRYGSVLARKPASV